MTDEEISSMFDMEAEREATTDEAANQCPKKAIHAPVVEPPPAKRLTVDDARARLKRSINENASSDALKPLADGLKQAKRNSRNNQTTAQKAVEIMEEKAELAKPCTSLDFAEWLDEPDEPDNPLIYELVENGSYVAIVGPAKSSKTWLEMQTAISIAAGVDWFGHKVAQRRVYVANVEVSGRQFKKRGRSICARLGINPRALKGWLHVDNLRGQTVTFDYCYWEARRRKAQVVILDPFYQIFKGKETDESDCQQATEEMKRFLAAGMTLFVVFHSPKGYAADRQIVDMISGSSVLARFPENVVAILPHATDKNARVVDCSVLRDYPAPDPFTVKFDNGALVPAPDIAPELKSGSRYAPHKSQAEREAEKVERFNKSISDMTSAAASFIEQRGENMPNSTELSDTLKRKFPRQLVEDFLKSIKAGTVAAVESVREMWRDPKSGDIREKPSRSGGKTFITTPEMARLYRQRFYGLPL